jgi:carbamoyltransferase
MTSADADSERIFGAATFAAFDAASPVHRGAAAALHDRLVAIGFEPRTAATLFGLSELTDVRPARVAFYDAFVLAHDAAGRAARFFVLHLRETDADLRSWLGDDLVAFLHAMAAIVRHADGWQSVVSVTWIGERLILADARAYNAVWPGAPPADYVMPPGRDSLGLVRVAPRVAGGRTLDVCCGSGVQALVAATWSDEVVGVDVNPRALRFARVNAAANRIERATFCAGDTFEPVGGERFDAILANPPFVPWPNDDEALLFRGGGARGEDVLQRILAGAEAHRAEAGWLAIVADFADVGDLGERIARWQGAPRRTLLVLERHYALIAYAETHASHLDDGAARRAEVVRLLRHYEASGIRTLDFGYLIQDGEAGRTHVMRTANALHGPLAVDVIAWFAHARRFARGDIDDAQLQFAPGLQLVTTTTTGADGRATTTYAVEPAQDSILEATTVSPLAFALLERVAAGTLRPREMDDPAEVGELARLLDGGWVRIRGTTLDR